MNLFAGWDKVLVGMKSDMKHRDEEVVAVLKSILQVLKENKRCLAILLKDYEKYFPPEGESH